MAKIFNHKLIERKFERWLEGKDHKLQVGDYVKPKGSEDPEMIGIIQFALKDFETYQVKWKNGPKAWDILYGTTASFRVNKVEITKNPFAYKLSERFPGPSQFQIEKLQKVFERVDADRIKNRTARDIEILIEAMEETMARGPVETLKKDLTEDDTIDSIVDSTLDEDTPLMLEDPVEKKTQEIIDGE
jgi:hypothetical protein